MKRKILSVILSALIMTVSLTMSVNAAGHSATSGGPGTYVFQKQANGGTKIIYRDNPVPEGWFKYCNVWYLISPEGYLLTGWQSNGGYWFYLSEVEESGHPYGGCYINSITPDGHRVDHLGVLVAEDGFVPVNDNPYGYDCIDVNLTTQTVNMYKGAKPLISSPCVTGRANSSRATDTGRYVINNMETNRYLRGLNADGTQYKSWVNYWMPFNGGQGLHDATWRSRFGGNIYTYDGSHGCVNLPLDVAAAIYANAYIGMPVIVHE